MSTIIDIPRSLMRVIGVDWDIDWRGKSVGGSTSGTDQVIYNAAPRWVGRPTLGLGREELLEWRALRATAQGRVGVYRVPMMDRASILPGPNPLCPGGANIGATEIDITLQPGGVAPGVGHMMSHDDWPFLVTGVEQTASGFTLSIQMPLRASIPAGDEIAAAASGLFRATSDDMGNPGYNFSPLSTVQLSFVEHINR